MKKYNHKKNQYQDGIPIPRVYHSKAKGKKSARYLIRCGDCKESLKIYYDPRKKDAKMYGIEIGGVLASEKDWRRILLPLLK